ncbi:MAG: hypothetical protein DRJ42_13435 [Deltaproteobacteria bacterium]|nr:MAG: hypothetical protein DRJ42_13435 [Deltaproteobacteria bacterium]
MRRFFVLCVLAVLFAWPLLADAQITPEPRRVAIVVGANAAAPGRRPLRYAHEDAREVRDVLRTVGGFAASDVHLFLDPAPSAVLERLDREVAELSSASEETMLLFYYSGHADERALYPGGRPLSFHALRQRLGNSAVTVRLGIIDTCRGGGWTGTRGLSETDAFDVEVPLDLSSEGSVLIASSSGLEDAHESEILERGFFTHHWNAALRGAGDQNGDQVVTLTEAFEYAKRLTVRDTALRTATPQHPSYQMNLRGRRDLPLARLTRGSSTIVLDQERGPTQLVDLETGLIVLETPRGLRTMRLAVPPGHYLVRATSSGETRASEVRLRAGTTTAVSESQMQRVSRDGGASRAYEPRPVTLTTLHAGAWDIRTAFGVRHADPGAGFSMGGGSESVGTALFQINYGITDRLQWVIPSLALAYRFGDTRAFEVIPWGGLTSWGLGYSSIDKLLISGSVGLGVDARWWVSPRGSLVGGLGFGSAFRWSSADNPSLSVEQAPTTWRLHLAAGYSHTLAEVVTLSLFAGYSQALIHEGGAPTGRGEWRVRVVLGSVMDLALRTVPLIKVHLGDVVSLDGHAAIEYDFATESVEETYMLGATFVF